MRSARASNTSAITSPTTSTPWLIGSLLGRIANYLAIAAMSYGVFQQVRNRPFTVGECISKGLRRLVPVLIVAVLVGVAQATAVVGTRDEIEAIAEIE